MVRLVEQDPFRFHFGRTRCPKNLERVPAWQAGTSNALFRLFHRRRKCVISEPNRARHDDRESIDAAASQQKRRRSALRRGSSRQEVKPKRLFVAISPPPVIQQSLVDLDPRIRGVRWTERNQMHLTLGFFPDTSEHFDRALRENLSAIEFRA